MKILRQICESGLTVKRISYKTGIEYSKLIRLKNREKAKASEAEWTKLQALFDQLLAAGMIDDK